MKGNYSIVTLVAIIVMIALGLVGIWKEKVTEEESYRQAKQRTMMTIEFMETTKQKLPIDDGSIS